jgi:YVTN family beta-propeller protein
MRRQHGLEIQLRHAVLALTAALVLQAGAPLTASAADRLLVVSKGDHALDIIDVESLKVIAHAPVGVDPHEVVSSADGRTAWVSIMAKPGDRTGYQHEIDVIDLVHGQALAPIDTGPLIGAHGLAIADGKLWFTAQGAKAIARWNPTLGRVDIIKGTGQEGTHMIVVTPDQKKIYVTNKDSGTVGLFDMLPSLPAESKPPEWKEATVKSGLGAEGFDVTPDGRELWTPAAPDGHIYIIDLQKQAAVADLDAHIIGANRLKFTPDGRFALITSLRSGELTVFDVAKREEVRRLKLGKGNSGLLISRDGSRAFVANTADDDISVVDLKTFAVVGHIPVAKPDGLAWAPIP